MGKEKNTYEIGKQIGEWILSMTEIQEKIVFCKMQEINFVEWKKSMEIKFLK